MRDLAEPDLHATAAAGAEHQLVPGRVIESVSSLSQLLPEHDVSACTEVVVIR